MEVWKIIFLFSWVWNLLINHLEKKMIFQASMMMFHVNLPGCKNLVTDPNKHPKTYQQNTLHLRQWVINTQDLCQRILLAAFGLMDSSCSRSDFEDFPRIFVTGVQWSKYVDVYGICICYISFIYICEYKDKYVKSIT